MKRLSKEKVRSIAFLEAAALLNVDCDAADLGCASGKDAVSEEDEEKVREYMRNEIVALLVREAGK